MISYTLSTPFSGFACRFYSLQSRYCAFNSLFGIPALGCVVVIEVDLSTPFSGFPEEKTYFEVVFGTFQLPFRDSGRSGSAAAACLRTPFNSLFGILMSAVSVFDETSTALSTPFSGFPETTAEDIALTAEPFNSLFGIQAHYALLKGKGAYFQLPFRDSQEI